MRHCFGLGFFESPLPEKEDDHKCLQIILNLGDLVEFGQCGFRQLECVFEIWEIVLIGLEWNVEIRQ